MATSYSGKILLNPILNDPNGDGMKFFRLDKVIINQDQWTYDESDGTYVFLIQSYQRPTVLRIFNPSTNADVLADCEEVPGENDFNKIRIRSISDDPLALELLYKYSDLDDDGNPTDDSFFPVTKSDLVRFADGESLEMKYRNGDLSNNALDPVFRESKFVLKVRDADFAENRGTYVLTIQSGTHKLGNGVVVRSVLQADVNGQLSQQTKDIDISLHDPADDSGTTVTIVSPNPFNGYVILEKEDLP